MRDSSLGKEKKREFIPFREGIFTLPDSKGRGPYLIATRCSQCKQLFFPQTILCLKCHSEAVEKVQLKGQGTLYSFTVCHMPAAGFEPPYAIGYVELISGIRVFGPITGWEHRELKIGMPMKMVVEPLKRDREGRKLWSYAFRPLEDDKGGEA